MTSKTFDIPYSGKCSRGEIVAMLAVDAVPRILNSRKFSAYGILHARIKAWWVCSRRTNSHAFCTSHWRTCTACHALLPYAWVLECHQEQGPWYRPFQKCDTMQEPNLGMSLAGAHDHQCQRHASAQRSIYTLSFNKALELTSLFQSCCRAVVTARCLPSCSIITSYVCPCLYSPYQRVGRLSM